MTRLPARKSAIPGFSLLTANDQTITCDLNCFVNYSESNRKAISSETFNRQEELDYSAESDDIGTVDWQTRHSETSTPAAAAY